MFLQKETKKKTKSEKKIKVRFSLECALSHVYHTMCVLCCILLCHLIPHGFISMTLSLSPQSKVEWIGEPTVKEGKKTFYSEVLISGNKVSTQTL